MKLKVLVDDRHRHRSSAMVSINPKLRRIVIYKKSREEMIQKYGQEFETVQIMFHKDIKDAFWLTPCDPDEEGARQLNATSDTTRTLSCSLLLKTLEWEGTKTERFPITWDTEHEAWKVDVSGRKGKEVKK